MSSPGSEHWGRRRRDSMPGPEADLGTGLFYQGDGS